MPGSASRSAPTGAQGGARRVLRRVECALDRDREPLAAPQPLQAATPEGIAKRRARAEERNKEETLRGGKKTVAAEPSRSASFEGRSKSHKATRGKGKGGGRSGETVLSLANLQRDNKSSLQEAKQDRGSTQHMLNRHVSVQHGRPLGESV